MIYQFQWGRLKVKGIYFLSKAQISAVDRKILWKLYRITAL